MILGPAHRRYDADRLCPACGFTAITDSYCGQQHGISIYSSSELIPEGPHLHRTCVRCGHTWVELALKTPVMARRMYLQRRKQETEEWRKALRASHPGLFG